VYGKIRPVDTSDKASIYGTLFTDGVGDHKKSLIVRNSMMVYPGVYSFDPPFLAFVDKLTNDLNDALPVDVDSNGFTKTGIHTDFSRLRTVAGYYMNPMSYVAVDNSEYRKSLGLRIGMSERERKIATEFWHLIWSSAKVVPVNVTKKSSAGMRRFSRDTQWKLDYAAWVMEPSQLERVLDATVSGDWLTLANEFEIVYGMYMQKRGQVDMQGKARWVFDYEYAVTGGTQGRNFEADKKVVLDGREYKDWSAVRARVVQAGPWAVNCFLQCIATPTMHAMFENFPSTFHVNTREQILQEIEGKAIFCSDVTEYDRSMDIEDIRLAHDVMAEYYDPRLATASMRLYEAPYYARPLELNGTEGRWVGDPTDWDSKVIAGNRSGHAMTSLIAKGNKVIETLIVIDRMYPVVGRVAAILRGEGVMGLINNGDDEVVWAISDKDLNAFKALRADLSVGRYVVEPEIGNGFSGLLLTKQGDRVYDPKPKVHTTFEKLLCPERAWGSFMRPYPSIGVLQRIDNIMATPQGRTAWELFIKNWRDMMTPTYGGFMDILEREHSRVELNVSGLTVADKAVLEDPDKLHYMYSASEVAERIVQATTSKIPIERVESFLRRYYHKGTLK